MDADGAPRPKRFRHFMPRWKKTWPWVDYDEEKNIMYCNICRKVCEVYTVITFYYFYYYSLPVRVCVVCAFKIIIINI